MTLNPEQAQPATISITESLGIYGLSKFDPPILAALANNSTLLMVGPHGSGKTLIAQKLAELSYDSFRHYNTSLLNYDDMVGYPIPDKTKKELLFIKTPGTIWESEFVLFDEISRARAEIQFALRYFEERNVFGFSEDDYDALVDELAKVEGEIEALERSTRAESRTAESAK